MTKKSVGEIEVALARHDVEALRGVLRQYFEWHQAYQRGPDEAAKRDDLFTDHIIHDVSDPVRSLALTALATFEFDDPMFLGLVAAGPLEDILMFDPAGAGTTASPSDEIFDRVMQEAKRNPRFRWMLGGIYTNHLTDAQQAEFDQTVSRIDWDALPPRPKI